MKKPPTYIYDAADADCVAALTRIARLEAVQKKIPEFQDRLKTLGQTQPGSLLFWETALGLVKELRESGELSQRDWFRPLAHGIEAIAL